MRGLRSFLVLLIVLIALGGYLYFVESKRTPGDDAPKREKVFAVEADKIDEIAIKSESGDRTTLRKTGDGWQIVQPAPAHPDPAEISGLTTNLSSLEIQSTVDENPADLKEYGLAEPRIEVAFKSGGQERRLHIGGKTPPGTDVYAKLADQKKVFLISSYLESTFNRGTFDLRDKTVLRVDREKLDAMEVAAKGAKGFTLAKVNGEWQLKAPAPGRADSSAVEGLVGRIGGLQMKSVAASDAAEARKYGLDSPAATVRLGSGSAQATLIIGGAAAADTVYARDASRPLIFTIDGSLVTDLKTDPGEYRQKDLFDARSFNATRIEIARNGQTFVFEKTKAKDKDGKEEEKWRQASPTARDVDQGKVEALISSTTGARADSFVDSTARTGLDKPELTAAIKSDEGRKDERVSFGRFGTETYAARADAAGAAKIPAATLDAIIKALDELK